MYLKNCASDIGEARKNGRQGNKQPVSDLGEHTGKQDRANIPELPNTTFMVVIHRVPNGNNDGTISIQFQTSYTDERHWAEPIYFIEK
jgi:hypothetical protein